MSWSLLERFLESDHFNNDPSLAVAYLSRYASHVGIQYVLCSKLRQFAYEEIEFFLPQLCHLLVSVDNESMALEEFVLDLCQESVSGALLTFWLFQTHLQDLSSDPTSTSFRTCRRIFNKVQHIVFGGASEPLGAEKIRANVLPVTVLASLVLAGVAAPLLPRDLGPLAIAQARKPQHTEDTISETPAVLKLARSHSVSGTHAPAREKKTKAHHTRTGSTAPSSTPAGPLPPHLPTSRPSTRHHPSSTSVSVRTSPNSSQSHLATPNEAIQRYSTSSLPEFLPTMDTKTTEKRISSTKSSRRPLDILRRHSQIPKSPSTQTLARSEQIRLLRSNYFRSETQFLAALEGISNRLVAVPKPARLSALRAELALIARDLPAEVDIPLLCPATLDDGSPSRSKHHRIVRISPAEATSLNSAERVPYLLMVEVLREDFDFDPDSEKNQRLLANMMTEKEPGKRRLFDIGLGVRLSVEAMPNPGPDSVFEPATGDLSSPSLLRQYSEDIIPQIATTVNGHGSPYLKSVPPRSSSGAGTVSSLSVLSTPRTSDVPNSRSSTPGFGIVGSGSYNRSQGVEQPDFSALATHMRTAAQMLAQLDTSGSKRPRHEVDAIKAKIIASMQSLEEQSFYSEDPAHSATFDTILADVQPSTTSESPTEFEDGLDNSTDPGMASGAGAARMENDQKTGGVRRKGDRDDPSAATFGEDWKSKRERIRRSSPYGYMKNWDLLSVIVKTGSDLRQEMFATQLIRICSKIWEDAGVPVWVKQMRILVTGESSGLIETIANGVSLHSLKRSLTLATIAAGTNPRKRIATLKDHFIRTFGEVDSPGYKAAADAFLRSLAAYSILSYILQLKDRHNGNILVDNAGHLIHIDFGFMLSNSPGSVGFEAAPFKLTHEYVDVLGGPASADFDRFKALCKTAFQALRKSAENVVSVVDMMGKGSKMACFASGGPGYATASLRQRFVLQMGREEAEGFVEDLVAKSLGSYYTRLYDTFQYRTQGIY